MFVTAAVRRSMPSNPTTQVIHLTSFSVLSQTVLNIQHQWSFTKSYWTPYFYFFIIRYVSMHTYRLHMCVKTNARNIQNHKMEMLYLKMRWNIWLLHTQEWSRPARPRPAALLMPRSNSKTRGCYCNCWAPDDGRVDARNMLSCTWTSSNKLEELLHLVGWFIWNVWWCTNLQTLNLKKICCILMMMIWWSNKVTVVLRCSCFLQFNIVLKITEIVTVCVSYHLHQNEHGNDFDYNPSAQIKQKLE
jgi:hypothetical protein